MAEQRRDVTDLQIGVKERLQGHFIALLFDRNLEADRLIAGVRWRDRSDATATGCRRCAERGRRGGAAASTNGWDHVPAISGPSINRGQARQRQAGRMGFVQPCAAAICD